MKRLVWIDDEKQRVVPKEATETMIRDAEWTGVPNYDGHSRWDEFDFEEVWSAMLAAAPSVEEAKAPKTSMVEIAKRNLRAYLSKASFAQDIDRQAALNCVEVIEAAMSAEPAVKEAQPVTDARLPIAIEALQFYADNKHWYEGMECFGGDMHLRECGDKAKMALAAIAAASKGDGHE